MTVDRIYGVGPKTAKLLEEKGIATIPDLAKTPMQSLEDALGRKLAVYLHNTSNGIDDEPVNHSGGITQLSRIITLKRDTHDVGEVMDELRPALRDVHERLVSKNLFFKNLSALGISKNLSLHTRSKTLETPTNDYSLVEKETEQLFATLLREVGDLRRAGLRIGEPPGHGRPALPDGVHPLGRGLERCPRQSHQRTT